VLLTGDGLTAEGIAAAAVKFRLRLRRRADYRRGRGGWDGGW
jgi:hypothetical protein